MPRPARKIDLYEEGEVIKDLATAKAPESAKVPETQDLQTQKVEIDSLVTFRVSDDPSYVTAKRHFSAVSDYISAVEGRFKEPKSAAHKVHKFITSMENFFLGSATLVKSNLNTQILSYERKKDEERRAEEARLARLAKEKADREAAEALAKYEAEIGDLMPWETPEPPPPTTIAPAPEPIRLPSTVPVVAGGPTTKNLPWAARITDPVAVLKWILENPADRLCYVEFRMPMFNLKSRELKSDMAAIIPGTEAFQGQTLVG
jgi:hypothetical protein